LKSLDRYAYIGHSCIVGKQKNAWQDIDSVLQHFGKRNDSAQKRYRDFVEKGVGHGRNPELTGGRLLRSVGGWGILKSMRRMEIHVVKGDERIMGDSDFVETVLNQASEQMEKRYRLQAKGWTLEKIIERAANIFSVEKNRMLAGGKQQNRVHARSVAAYWAISYPGLTATAMGRDLGLSKSAVSRAAERGRRLVAEQSLTLEE
jgi:putative transposase